MNMHCLQNVSLWGAERARIGLLDPISARDSLALAWAKASVMCELGASAGAIQGELARVMAPHAVGVGDLERYEFEDADQVTLQAMARALNGRQARQLAQDVGLAAEAMASEEAPKQRPGAQGWAAHAQVGQTARVIGGIGGLGRGFWIDPLARRPVGDGRAGGERAGEARYACERLRFKRHHG